MIKDVYLIHESGLCLVSNSFSRDPINKDIISGFLLAILNFSQKILEDSLQEIKMEKNTIIYDIEGPILLALVFTGRKPTKRNLNRVIKQIFVSFFDEYAGYLEEEIIEPTLFTPFADKINLILHKNKLVKTIRI
ncbi:MAG: hypothetical protein ACTSPV_09015 [Candidatus Hodarchaeales archaeon]